MPVPEVYGGRSNLAASMSVVAKQNLSSSFSVVGAFLCYTHAQLEEWVRTLVVGLPERPVVG